MTKDELKTAASALGFSAVGVCDVVSAPHLDFFDQWVARQRHADMDWLAASRALRSDPETLLPGGRSIIAVTLDYNRPNPYVPGHPRIARYALGRDYHKVLRGKLKRLAGLLEAEGFAARPCVDSAPIFERDYAHLAGLGWFGKNTMLIDSRRGSWFFLGLLLTTASFEPDAPAEGGCGTCTRCIDACPTGAIVFADGRWGIDSGRCISYLTIEHEGPIPEDLATQMGPWTFGCDVCQEVCPFNEQRLTQPLRGALATEPDFLRERPFPSLEGIEAMTETEWDLLTQGSAIRRTGLEGLKRNARINRANGS